MTYTDPNDRTTPRPCIVCREDFIPGARGRISTTCGREACRKALQRANRRHEEAAPLALLGLHLAIYGDEPEEPGLPPRGSLLSLSEDWGLDFGEDVRDDALREELAPGHVQPHPYVNGPDREHADPFAADAAALLADGVSGPLEDYGTGSSHEGDRPGLFDPRRVGSGIEEAETWEEVVRSPSWDVGSTAGDSDGPRPHASSWEIATHSPERLDLPVLGSEDPVED